MFDVQFSTVQPDELADSYANDPRVDTRPSKAGYTVRTPDGVFEVLHSGMFGWCLCQGPTHDFVQLPEGGVTDANLAIGVSTAGDMIRALIGEPQQR